MENVSSTSFAQGAAGFSNKALTTKSTIPIGVASFSEQPKNKHAMWKNVASIYELRGWDEQGVPTTKKKSLDLA